MIALAQCGVDYRTFDRAAVDEDQLLRARLPAQARLTDQTRGRDFRVRVRFNFQQPRHQLGSMQIANAVAQGISRRQLEDDALIAHENESDLWMPGGLQVKLMLDVAALGIFRAEKFSAGGQIIKKRSHFDLGAGCFSTIAHRLDPSAGDDDLCTRDRAGFTTR